MNKKVIYLLLSVIIMSVLIIYTKIKKTTIDINYTEFDTCDKIQIIQFKDTLTLFKKENKWYSKNELEINDNQIENFKYIIENLTFKNYPSKNFYQNLKHNPTILTNIYSQNELLYSLSIIGASSDGLAMYSQSTFPNNSDTILSYVIGNQEILLNYFSTNELDWSNKKVFPFNKSDFKSIEINFPSAKTNYYVNCLDKKISSKISKKDINEKKLSIYLNTMSNIKFISSVPCNKKSPHKIFTFTVNGFLKYEAYTIIENEIENPSFYILQHQKNCYLMRYIDTDPLLVSGEYLTE